MRERNQGITLIALIITIIILLILATISVNIAIKGDLFGKAGKAVDKTNDKVAQEQSRVDELMGELTKVEQNQCTHEWGEWIITKEATDTEKGTKERTCTKCGKVEIGETIKLVIGANINYHEYIGEDGTALSTMPSYTSAKEKTGHDSDQVFTVANNSGIEWIVLGEEDGQIKITTKNIIQPTSGGETNGSFQYYRLRGQAGYTNFVEELHEIGAIYGKGKYADTNKFNVATGGKTGGRSFIMEDLGYGSLTREESYTYALHDNGRVYGYDVGQEVDGTSTNGGTYTTFKYMEMDASTTTKEEGKEWKELKTAANGGPTSVTMYQYKYPGSRTLSTTVSTADTGYWLASRCLTFYTDYVYFLARRVGASGGDYQSSVCSSHGSIFGLTSGVRPVVYLKSDIQLEYDAKTGYTIK